METNDAAGLLRAAQRTPAGRRAVVAGASLAGLLAARVLAEHFDEVLLIDREALPAGNAHRRATPHTWHAHGLLARGRAAMEQLFPGITEEWLAQGGRCGDAQRSVAFYAGRERFAPGDSGITGIAVGRVVVEGAVRRRVLALPNVRVLAPLRVLGPLWDAALQRVRGLCVAPDDAGGSAFEIAAELVVDATGRASHLPQWLAGLGFPVPVEERVHADIRYATAYFERRPDELPGLEVVIATATAAHPRPAVLIGQEQDRWVVTLAGYGRDAPPLDRSGFVARARDSVPEIAAVVAAGRFLGEPQGYRFPHSQRRRVERLARWPRGLLAIGDALCSFNPVYGQGMSVAAAQALALGEELAAGRDGLEPRVLRRAARIVDTPWTTAAGADLAIPAVEGARPLPVRLVNRYMERVFEAACADPAVGRAFLAVAHLLAPPQTLFAPALLWRVFRAAGRRAASPHTPAPHRSPRRSPAPW